MALRLSKRYVAGIGLLCVVYIVTAKIGLHLDAVSGFAAVVWPPTGIALAALLLCGYAFWPGIAVGAFLVNLSAGAPALTACGLAVGNTLEALLGTWLLRRSGFRNDLERLRDVLVLIAFAALLSPLVSATIGVTSLWASRVLLPHSYWPTWEAWWIGDVLGALIVSPLILVWAAKTPRRVSWHPAPILEVGVLLLSLTVVNVMVFWGLLLPEVTHPTIIYLCFPFLSWAALRFGQRGAVTCVFLTAVSAIWATAVGASPFSGAILSQGLMRLQFFMAVAAVTTMILAAIVTERFTSERRRRETEEALRRLNDELEQRVQERTATLAKANLLLQQEITERRRVEKELRNQTRILESILESLADGVAVADRHGNFLLFNAAAERILGMGLTEAPPEEWAKRYGCYLPDGLTLCPVEQLPLVCAMRGESVDDAEFIIRNDHRPEGIWLHVTARPLRLKNDSGIVMGGVIVFRDVTERKRMEEAARASKERFRAVVETARDAIVSSDRNGRVISWNRGAEAIFGYAAEEILSQPLTVLMPPRFRDAHQAGLARLKATGESRVIGRTLELAGLRKDGTEFPLELSLSTWTTSEGSFVTAIIRDATERKQAEERLRRTNELLVKNQEQLLDALLKVKRTNEELRATQLQLIQAAKLESVGRLAAGVAHEVKNPLATLLIGIDHLVDHFRSQDGGVSLLLQDMQRAVRKADAVIKGLLDFSSPEKLEMSRESLNEVLEQALVLVKNLLDRNHVTVVKDLSPELLPIQMDRSKIEQVFVNLFLNAGQAMPSGGLLTIRTSVRQSRSTGRKRGRRQDELFPLYGLIAVVEVMDSGAGIPKEKLAKVFDPFFTTKPTGQGTGLGLTVSRKIVALHGGAIDIRNRPEGGVAATVMFNAERREPAWTRSASSSSMTKQRSPAS